MCREAGIQVTAFSNLASSSYVELGMAEADESPLQIASVCAIAAAHSKTSAQVLLRWGIQRGTQILPKSVKVERLRENMDLYDFSLTSEEMDTIASLDKKKRYNDPGVFAEGAFKTFYCIYD